MNNNPYNETLIQLEQDLKELASARDQVLSVTNKGEAVVLAFTKVLKSLDDFLATASFDQTSFEENIQQRFNEANESFTNFNAGLESQLKELGNGQKNANNAVKEVILEEAKKVSETVSSFNESIEKKKESFGEFLTKMQESISENEAKVRGQFSSLEREMKGTMEQLANLDLTTHLNETEQRLKESSGQLQIEILSRITALEELINGVQKSVESGLAKNNGEFKAAIESLRESESKNLIEKKLERMNQVQVWLLIGVLVSAGLSFAALLM